MNTAELIQKEVKTLPNFKVQEVLDFILFLKTRNKNDKLPRKSHINLTSEILKIGNNCASLPLLDDRTAEEILGFDDESWMLK